MFDPVSLAVMALTSAIIAGAKEAGKNAGGDSYQLLRGHLIRRYGDAAEVGIANLERQPGAREYQDDLARVLRGMGAEQDQDLGGLAQGLYDLVEEGVKDDPLEQPKRAAGVNAVGRLLDTHIQWLSDIRSRFPVGDSQLLSSDVATAPDIPQELRAQVSTLHERMRAIIQQVAIHIENDKYQEAEQLPQTLPNLIERDRAGRLVQADKAIHISYGSLALAVGFFSELNETILARIEQERSDTGQTQMMFGNAIMIYELAAFAIDFIANFTLGGVAEVEALHRDTMSRIGELHEAQERLTAIANREGVEPGARENALEDIRHRKAALNFLRDEWDGYVRDTKQFHKRVEEVQDKVPTLELIRENARVQLDVLELVAMLRFLRQNAVAVRATVESLQAFRLAPLTPARVRRLIGPTISG
jgi:hypothetical protein